MCNTSFEVNMKPLPVMRIMLRPLLLGVLLITGATVPIATAQVLTGRAMSGLYTWGRDLPDEGPQTYYRFYQGTRFQIKGKQNRRTSFHVSYRYAESFGDFTGKEYSTTRWRRTTALSVIHSHVTRCYLLTIRSTSHSATNFLRGAMNRPV